jgi:alkanesulfonate monooxygenase SsuD/methylene tetrahydromethanopterin reductase-like flavin-dependent oxidoreductase (luciferase family)
MQFGVFDHLDKSDLPLGEFYENRLRLAEVYDQIGIYALHTAEHHATPLGMAPSPSVFHSAATQRTRRLRLGPLVYTLNLHHPLRLAEEICMLDHMSGGRFQLGVGRGISPFELAYFGADPADGAALYIEAFEVIKKALTSRIVNHDGRFFSYREVPVELHPLQKPYPPIWYGLGNPDSVSWCVENRVNIVTNAPAPVVREITERYRSQWVRAGNDLAALPFIGTTRHMVIADTDRAALDIARRAYRCWHASFMHLFKKHNAQPRFAIYSDDFDEVCASGLVIAGSAARVRDTVMAIQADSGMNYLLCRFAFGDMTFVESMRSIDLFAEQVMPACAGLAGAMAHGSGS